jgi:hypothetical protein
VESLILAGGNGQIAPAGTEFTLALTVRASNQDRDPVAGAWVVYTITDDGRTGTRFVGVDQTPTVTTSSSGDAVSSKLIAGHTPGFVTVTATSNGKAVTFLLVVSPS